MLVAAAQFIKQKLPDLLRSYVDADLGGNQEGGFQDIAIEVLHLLLSHLLFGQKGASGVGQEQIDAFLKTLCRGVGDRSSSVVCVCVGGCTAGSAPDPVSVASQISPRSAVLWCSHHCCTLKNGTFPWTGSCQTQES